jgi:AraC-like DNA-binding protein
VTHKVLTYKDRVVFGLQTMPYFDRMPKEYVENEACFVFVNKGELSIRSQDSRLDFDASTGVLAKCLNYFYETNEEQSKSSDCIEAIGVILYPGLVEEIFEFDLSTSTYQLDYNIKQVQVDLLLQNFKESIKILIENPELADENIIKTKLREFVLLMSKSQNAPSQLDFLSALFKPNDVEFKSVIQHNLYANLSLDELAALCHLSVSSFKRKFKETFNDSPKKYIAKKKVEKAANLLKTEGLRISDIAYDVGFESLATFNRNFTSIYGKSPSEFRLS